MMLIMTPIFKRIVFCLLLFTFFLNFTMKGSVLCVEDGGESSIEYTQLGFCKTLQEKDNKIGYQDSKVSHLNCHNCTDFSIYQNLLTRNQEDGADFLINEVDIFITQYFEAPLFTEPITKLNKNEKSNINFFNQHLRTTVLLI